MGTGDRGRLDSMVSELGGTYNITNIGMASYLLGFSIYRNENGIFLDQATFLRSTLEEVETPRSTLCDHRSNEDGSGEVPSVEEAWKYCRLLRRVMYAANCTRPDICFAVSMINATSAMVEKLKPSEEHQDISYS